MTVSELHLEKISRLYSIAWRKLSPYLELKSLVAADIDRRHTDEAGKRREFLQRWKMIRGADATYENLVRALLEVGHRGDASDVCKLMQDSASESGAQTSNPYASSSTGGYKVAIALFKHAYILQSQYVLHISSTPGDCMNVVIREYYNNLMSGMEGASLVKLLCKDFCGGWALRIYFGF